LFQVMLVFEPSTPNEVAFGDIQVDFPEFQPGIAKFDLLLRVAESKSGLRIAIEYSKSLFAVSTIERLAEHFSAMLEKIVAEPDARLGDISLLTAAERQRMLETWNRTEAHYRTVLLHELFEEQAKADPAKVALTCDGRQFTYLEIHRQANQLARYLRKSGVGREARVGVCMNRTPEMVMVLLAILKAGGTYVPLDPAYPRDRLLYMLQDARAEVLVIHSQFKTQFDEDRIKTIVIDEEWEQATRESCEDIQSGVDPQNLAYLIYTSGSTGKPKGVAITHNSAGVFLHWAREVFTDEELSGVLISTSICFDLSVFEIFVPLSWGGKGILVTNVLDLPGYMDSGEVRLVNTVPSAIRELLQMKGVPPSVITVNLAGEALKRSLVTAIYGQGHIQKVFNLYGPSEDTTYSTFVLVNREKEGAVAIGKPIANTRVYVVDREMVAVPVGVAGELYIGGEGLARGYLNRPDLTGERFVPDPFSSAGGERLYRTGDQVRWRGDGKLEFLGRLDQQVKVRGYRIELGEIETALLGHEAVEQAVVTVRGEHDKYVAAYVVGSRRGEEVSAAELRGYVKGILPEYMVPAAFVFLEELPLTPNGKVDRKGLPEPERQAGGEYVGPGNETEELLCRMWEEVLGLEKVGVEDNFFELGGHSLLATQLISRVRSTFEVDFPLQMLFERPTIAALAEIIDECRIEMLADESLSDPFMAESNLEYVEENEK